MKLAIIGSYGHCGMVLDALSWPQAKNVRLVAAAKYGPDDPMGFVGKSPAAPASLKVYDDYRAMLDEVRPDAVVVFMPLYRNAEASIAAAQRGCHILSEKPLATTSEDLHALREAVGRANVRLAALLNMRADAPMQTVRKIVAEGRIGEPILASARKSYPFSQRDDYYKNRRTYGGSIPWQAIHAIDFASFCCGKDYSRAAGMHSNAAHPTHPGMEDNGGILLAFVGGGHAVIAFDYLRPWSEGVKRAWGGDALCIAGTEGMVETVDDLSGVRLMTNTTVEAVPMAPARNVVVEFFASIEGKGPCVVSADESFRATEVALAARDAADTGTVVAV